MKNISLKSRFLVLILSICVANPAHAIFGSSVVFDPTHHGATIVEGTKRAAEAARQIQVEINQYQQMIRDGIALADPVFKPIGDTFRSLYSVYTQGQNLMYRAQNLDSMFGIMYPSYYTYLGTMGHGRSTRESINERYRAWSDKGYENTRTAMMAANVRVNGMASEQAMLEQLAAQASSTGGQKQALDAGNQIAANLAQQMQDLRSIAVEQNMLQANYISWQVERQTHSDAFSANYRKAPIVHSPGREF